MALTIAREKPKPEVNGTPTRREAPAREDIARWLSALIAPEGCVELRAVGVGRKGQGEHVESTFFTLEEVDEMAKAAAALSGRARAVYWTLNPVHAGLYLAVNNASAKSDDILSRRWLLVDCDPIRPDSNSSSDDVEKSASAFVASLVRKHLRSLGWPEPIHADSGNGHHLLYRIDLPNDEASKALIKACLEALSAEFSTSEVAIDRAVHDAPRLCKLYGTMARKGEHSVDRPHRYSRVIDLPEEIGIVSADMLRALAEPKPEVPPAPAPAKKKGLTVKSRPKSDPVRAYITKAFNEEIDRLVNAPQGDRNNQLNRSAFALGRFVGGGHLGEGEVIAALSAAADRCGLELAETRKSIASGLTAGRADPRDLSEVGKPETNGQGHGGAAADGAAAPAAGGGPMEADDDPHRLAAVFLAERCRHEHGLTLRFWLERWHRWDGSAWRILPDAEVTAEVTESIKREFDRIAVERGKTTQAVGTKTVGNVLQALRSMALLSGRNCPRQPAWLEIDGPNPLECLSAKNGIVHLPSLLEGSTDPIPPTPRFFSPNALEYEFSADAPKPVEWLKFLDALWDDDPDSIACLQEWFGYLITPDTRQQKMLLIIGPRRSGKGTMLRVLRALVGASNVAAPTLSGLATHFGAAPLIGKSLAIVPDARLSARADAQVIIERLLSITGEDPQTIDRKHREDWTGDLLTRFAIASNELPRMGDASGALPGRVVLLRLTRTFFGREDVDLYNRLAAELPGICLWAVRGWQRLRERGRFLQPASGQELLDELDELSSPVNAFIEEMCVTGSECRVPVKDLYLAWKKWCDDRGRDHPGDEQGFGKNLRAALPKLGRPKRVGGRGVQVRVYHGIKLQGDGPDY